MIGLNASQQKTMRDALRKSVTIIPEPKPLPRDLIKKIAMDIGKDVVAYIEVQYPEAIKATSSTFRLSLRNSIYNEIMAALETTDEDAVRARLAARKSFRRQQRAAWKRIRETDWEKVRSAKDV